MVISLLFILFFLASLLVLAPHFPSLQFSSLFPHLFLTLLLLFVLIRYLSLSSAFLPCLPTSSCSSTKNLYDNNLKYVPWPHYLKLYVDHSAEMYNITNYRVCIHFLSSPGPFQQRTLLEAANLEQVCFLCNCIQRNSLRNFRVTRASYLRRRETKIGPEK